MKVLMIVLGFLSLAVVAFLIVMALFTGWLLPWLGMPFGLVAALWVAVPAGAVLGAMMMLTLQKLDYKREGK